MPALGLMLAAAAALVMVIAIALAGRSLRGFWWDSMGSPEEEEENPPASGTPTGKQPQRWTM